MQLTERDRRLLAALGGDPEDVDVLAAELDRAVADLADRLDALADNGLVREADDGRYRRTESGRRLLRTDEGHADAAVDTSPAVEEAIAGADLPPDADDAVRGAYAFLRYWGEASTDELVDAVYPEWPAGFESPEEWWAVVGDALEGVPDVVRLGEDAGVVDVVWRYAGTPEVTTPEADGFLPSERRGHHHYGSVKHAIESLDRPKPERDAVRAAFGVLRRRGSASRAEIAEAVFDEHSAGYESVEGWWNGLVSESLAELPGVGAVEGDRWRYDFPPTE